MYDLESFNAVTSLARHGIIMAYSFAERFLANNHYFPDIERLLNYIIVLANAAPSKEIIDNLVAKYNLFIPTCMDISESLLESMQNYDPGCSQGWVITETIKNFAPHEQIYIFYAKNLYNLITCNSAFFKQWITDFMNTDKQVTVTEDIDPKKIFKIDEDLLCALTTIYDSYLNGMNTVSYTHLIMEEGNFSLTRNKISSSVVSVIDPEEIDPSPSSTPRTYGSIGRSISFVISGSIKST